MNFASPFVWKKNVAFLKYNNVNIQAELTRVLDNAGNDGR
jgi:hypothetical protein